MIHHTPNDLVDIGETLWSSQAARDLSVQVEVRDGPADSFGKGRKVQTTFGALLDGASPNLYLTTQEIPEGELLGAPLSAITGELPLRPELLGCLVPQSINLWLGRSATPSSSGLHHDFHDNLYVLLHGRKRFRLFSPADAHRMYTRGRLRRVHPNGRINYLGQPVTSEDGREAEDVLEDRVHSATRAQRRAERRLERAEAAAARAEPDADAELEAAEDALDAAMDRAITAQTTRDRRRSTLARRATQREASTRPAPSAPPSFSHIVDLPSALARCTGSGSSKDERGGRRGSDSRRGGVASKYQLLAEAHMAECELKGGEMLYLPAGWFHEVSSDGGGGTHAGLHCALNYWYHPPSMDGSFERPYPGGGRTHFWEREWRRLVKAQAQRHAQMR